MRFLRGYIAGVRPSFLGGAAEGALFLNGQGRRFSYRSLQHFIQRLCPERGLEHPVTAHTLRRSCTTELIRSGANVYHVKELLGHESLRTLKPYTLLTIVDLKKTHARCHPRERDRAV